MSHGTGRLCPVFRHRQDLVPDILIGIAENLVQAVAHFLRMHRNLPVRNRKLRQMEQVLVKPLSVRMKAGIIALALFIRQDLPLLCVRHQEFSRLKAGLLHDVGRVMLQHPHLGGQDQPSGVSDIVAGRAQAVSVKRRPDHLSVRENDRGRTVPRLHHGRIVMVEVLPWLRHEPVVLPRLRDRDHHRQRKVHPVHVQEFQRIVQHGRIRAGFGDDRIDLVHLLLQHRGVHGLLSGEHPVHVSPDRVDLPVVGNHPVGVRAHPRRRRIRGKARVDDSDRGPKTLILQIREEPSQLAHQKHALVDNGSRGQRADIGVILPALFELPPHDIEKAVEPDPLQRMLRLFDKALVNARHAAFRPLPEDLRVYRHLAPSQKR